MTYKTILKLNFNSLKLLQVRACIDIMTVKLKVNLSKRIPFAVLLYVKAIVEYTYYIIFYTLYYIHHIILPTKGLYVQLGPKVLDSNTFFYFVFSSVCKHCGL